MFLWSRVSAQGNQSLIRVMFMVTGGAHFPDPPSHGPWTAPTSRGQALPSLLEEEGLRVKL